MQLNLAQIGINECLNEMDHQCETSLGCYTEVAVDWTNPYNTIQANYSAFVGLNLITKAKCQCFYNELLNYFVVDQNLQCDIEKILCGPSVANDYDNVDLFNSINGSINLASSTSAPMECRIQDKFELFTRGFITSITSMNFKCSFNGASAEQPNNQLKLFKSAVSFNGNSILWLDPLPICNGENVLSVQISTTELNGIIFYYGPMKHPPKLNERMAEMEEERESDFMFLELVNGKVDTLFSQNKKFFLEPTRFAIQQMSMYICY